MLASFGDVDGALAVSFRVEDFGTLATFGGHLTVHGFCDGGRGVEVADLVAETDETPFAGGCIDCGGDLLVQGCTFTEDVVKGPGLRLVYRLHRRRDGAL